MNRLRLPTEVTVLDCSASPPAMSAHAALLHRAAQRNLALGPLGILPSGMRHFAAWLETCLTVMRTGHPPANDEAQEERERQEMGTFRHLHSFDP